MLFFLMLFWYSYDDSLANWLETDKIGTMPWPIWLLLLLLVAIISFPDD